MGPTSTLWHQYLTYFVNCLSNYQGVKIYNCHGHFKSFIITHPHEFHYWPEDFYSNFYYLFLEVEQIPSGTTLPTHNIWVATLGLGIAKDHYINQCTHWPPVTYYLPFVPLSAIGQVWNQTKMESNEDGIKRRWSQTKTEPNKDGAKQRRSQTKTERPLCH